jgi:acyl-CoA thioesterase II
MGEPIYDLTALFDLERIDRNLFRGPDPGEGNGRLFGGQVASQALRAAGHTVDAEHHVNSLHTYFLRPGRFGIPVVFTVDRIRDGASFTTRRVVATQDGEAILNLDASFHADEEGGEFQPDSPVDSVPPPDSIDSDRSRHAPHHRFMDTRPVEVPGDPDEVRSRWLRTAASLPDDPILHACAITFMTDTGPLGAIRRAVGGPEGDSWRKTMMTASLDHCLWFHHPMRADQWHLYRLDPQRCGRARGLARGQIWTVEGRLAVTVQQEALLRWRR